MAKQFGKYGVVPAEFRTSARSPAFVRRVAESGLKLGLARDAISGLDRGKHIFGLTKGQFSMIDIAAAVLEKTGPADVSVWTWCIAEYEVEAFSAFFADRRVSALRVVMDWAGAQRDMPIVGDLQDRFGVDCIRVTKTHAKIVTVATECGWRVVIRGSMNLNANPRFEQFDVSDDEAIFDTVDDVMSELWERGKALPVRKLAHKDAVDLFSAETVQAPPVSWFAGGNGWFGCEGESQSQRGPIVR